MKHLRLLLKHEMISLEPNGYNTDSSSATVILKDIVCQSLVRLDAQMRFQPDLAESWTVSDDYRLFRFKLRQGVRFHSGRILDSEIVAWNFQRLFDTRSNSLLRVDYSGLEHVKAIARDEVEFRFAETCVPFLHNLAWRTHIVDDKLTQPMGTGPFEVVEWVRRTHVKLRRFADYWEKGRPKVDEITIRWAPDSRDAVAAIESGDFDIIESVPAAAAAGLMQRGLLECEAVSSPRKTVIAFNCKEPPFNDVRMRQAVAHAVDRQTIIDAIFGDKGRLVNGVLPANDPWAVPLKTPEIDIEKARQLVKDAGYPDGVTIKAQTTNVAPVPKVAEKVCADLERVGIRLDLRGFDDPPWWPYLYLEGQWQLCFQGASARPHIHTLFLRDLVSGGAFNPGGFSSTRLDELVSKARATLDEAEQKKLYGEAQHIVHDEVAILPLYAADVFAGWRPGVKGFRPHPLGYLDLRDVTIGG